MLEDRFGNSISTEKKEAVEAVDHFADQLLRLGPKAEEIIQKTEEIPECLILHILSALFYLYGQTAESQKMVKKSLQQAKALLAHANEREKSLYHIIDLWCRMQLTEALAAVERHCSNWKRDLVALKMAEFLFYCKGQEYEGARFLALTESLKSAWEENPFFLSIHSFALELNKHYSQAEESAKRALELDQDNPWAHHTLSHVFINQARIDEGIAALESFVPIWQESGRLIESHNLWHLALLYLENVDFSATLKVYDRAEWKTKIDEVGEEVDAASLLWRLEMEQCDVSCHWKELAKGIDGHASFGTIPFVSAQLCYALKRGGQNEILKETLESLNRFAETQKGQEHKIWKEVGCPLIYGSVAFADGNYNQAISYLNPIMERVGSVGGSDAQVALFRHTYLKSLIGAKKSSEALQYLETLTKERSLTLLEQKWQEEILLL